MLTNVFGMIWGYAAWKYFLRQHPMGEHVVYGYSDDLLVMFNDTDDVSHENIGKLFADCVKALGLTAHPDKQHTEYGDGRKTSFLGHVFHHNNSGHNGRLGVYPICRGASRVLWYEHCDIVELPKEVNLSYDEFDLYKAIARVDVSSGSDKFTPYCHLIVSLMRDEHRALLKTSDKLRLACSEFAAYWAMRGAL